MAGIRTISIDQQLGRAVDVDVIPTLTLQHVRTFHPPYALVRAGQALPRPRPAKPKPRYNIAPTQDVLAIRLERVGQQEAVQLRWGLIPFWAKDEKISYSTINARAETVARKPAFRDAFKKRRCLIAADGYYEWKKPEDGSKQPYRITLDPEQPFSFAGLWEHWEKDNKVIESCTIIVTDANELTKDIHGRMPVILDPATTTPGLTVRMGRTAAPVSIEEDGALSGIAGGREREEYRAGVD